MSLDRVRRNGAEPEEPRAGAGVEDGAERDARGDRRRRARVEVEEEPQHLERLPRRAGRVGGVVRALAEEALAQEARRLEHDALRVLERLGPDELRHLDELALALEELHG